MKSEIPTSVVSLDPLKKQTWTLPQADTFTLGFCIVENGQALDRKAPLIRASKVNTQQRRVLQWQQDISWIIM
jgi:hypothetical protein